MITKIEILADDVHVHFNGENSEIFPNICAFEPVGFAIVFPQDLHVTCVEACE